MPETENILKLQESAKVLPLYLNAMILCAHSSVLGSSIYFAAITLPYHKSEAIEEYMSLSEDLQSWFLSLLPLCMLIVSLLINSLAERLGRKKTLILSNLLTISGMLIMYLAPTYQFLFIGRAIGAFGVGSGAITAYTFMSEIGTIKIRPVFSNVVNCSIASGSLILYVVNMVLPSKYLHFYVISASLLFIILASLFLTESPQWLVRKERLDEAKKAFRFLRGSEYSGVDSEIKEIQEVLKANLAGDELDKRQRWKSRRFMHPLGIIVVLMVAIALCGLMVINIYGPSMFAEFGLTLLPYRVLVIIIPVGGFLGYLVGLPLLGCMRKRDQFVVSSACMTLASGCLGSAYYVKENFQDYHLLAEILFLIGALGFPLAYGAGVGAVVFSLPGELMAPQDKAVGVTIALSSRLVFTFIAIKTYPFFLGIVGYPGMFTFFIAVQMFSSLFVIKFLPETRNKSIAELDQIFRAKTAS